MSPISVAHQMVGVVSRYDCYFLSERDHDLANFLSLRAARSIYPDIRIGITFHNLRHQRQNLTRHFDLISPIV